MKPKFQKTIVISGNGYRDCLQRLAFELWDEAAWDRLDKALDEAKKEVTTDDLRWQFRATRKVLRTPFFRRAQVLAGWPDDAQQMLRTRIVERISASEGHPAVRVSAVKFPSWLTGEVLYVTRAEKIENERIRRLAVMSGYCDWLSRGGDAEVGRLLALWVEDVVADDEPSVP